MRRIIYILIGFLLLSGRFLAVEKVIFKDGFNLENKLAENEVFFKECVDVEIVPAENAGYFLDKTYGMIFKADLTTGKLLKTISSKGQGPGELHLPVSLRIRNGKIFVLDKGFMGVKIFDPEGKFVDCFKIGAVLFDRRNLYVNEKNEIFVAKIDPQANTMVTVYDIKGKELRSMIRYLEEGEKDNTQKSFTKKAYLINLDSKGNVYILYYILRDLAKFDKNGNQLWKVHIKNEILDQFPDDDYAMMDEKKYQLRWSIYNIDITSRDKIIVGHAGGGCVFSEDGKIKSLILANEYLEEEKKTISFNLDTFKIRENIFLNVLGRGKYIYKYEYKEE